MSPGAARGTIARLAVEVEPFHLDRPFDYRIPDEWVGTVRPGMRVQVGFAGRSRRALVLDVVDRTDVEPSRLRDVKKLLGEHVWATPDEVEVFRWAADRFAGPLGDVVRHALPSRTIDVERRAVAAGWLAEDPVQWAVPTIGSRAAPTGSEVAEGWAAGYGDRGAALWSAVDGGAGSHYWRPLPDADVGARLAELVLLARAGGRGALVLVPDPVSAVADAVVAAAAEAGEEVVDLRGGLSPRRQYGEWLKARAGVARIVVGERGAVFTPVAGLGLTVVVDEANPAFKERRSPRHHVREVALERARRTGGVGLLVGTVPSAPAWRLLADRRVDTVIGERARERRAAPQVKVADEEATTRTVLASDSVRAIRDAVKRGRHAVVLSTRRGEGRVLVCTSCRERVACPDCDGSTQPAGSRLGCLLCGWAGIRRCRSCGGRELQPLAAGTGRLADEVRRNVDVPVAVLEGYAPDGVPPAPSVLVVTRGAVLDHPPGPVGAVVLADLDSLVRRPTLDAAEDALRLGMQVARWAVAEPAEAAGASRRTDAPVLLQTREPDHPVVRALQSWDPGGFWTTEASVRRLLRFPPVATAIALDAPAKLDLRTHLGEVLPPSDDLLGPIGTGERRRWMLKADDRRATLRALAPVRAELSQSGHDLRVDVDPVQLT